MVCVCVSRHSSVCVCRSIRIVFFLLINSIIYKLSAKVCGLHYLHFTRYRSVRILRRENSQVPLM